MKNISKRFIKIFTLLFILSSILSLGVSAENVNIKSTTPIVKRIGGDNRVLTSVKVSQNAYKSSETVILIGSKGEIDALGGTLLASKLDAPIIMTDKNSLTPATKTEIERLKPTNIIILGGEGVVSKNVVNSLSEYNVERIDGKNREETSIKIARKAVGNKIDEVFLGLGYDVYADALAIGAATAKLNKPLLLSKKNGMSDETINAIKDFDVKKVTIVGGSTVVPVSVENKLKTMGLTVNRIYGNNREETSIKIAETYFKNPSEVIIANGYVFADSVVGGYYGYKNNAPIILTRNNKLVASTFDYVAKTKKDVTVLGLYGAIDKTVELNLNKALKGEEIEKPVEKPDLDDGYTFGSSFIYDTYSGKFKVNMGTSYSFDTITNRFSDNNGDKVVKIPVIVENIGNETGYLYSGHISAYNSLGNSTQLSIRSYFDDGNNIYESMRPGSKASGSIYILYSGDGNYYLTFDKRVAPIPIEFKLPIKSGEIENPTPEPKPEPTPEPENPLINIQRQLFLNEIDRLATILENVKNQKTVKQLVKKEDGTFDWEYVADAKKVAIAQKNYDDKYFEYITWENSL